MFQKSIRHSEKHQGQRYHRNIQPDLQNNVNNTFASIVYPIERFISKTKYHYIQNTL